MNSRKHRRYSLEKLAVDLIMPCIEERARKMAEINFLGVHENIRISMKRVGVEIKKNSSPPSTLTYTNSSPPSDSSPQDATTYQTPSPQIKRKRCDICIGNDNKHRNICIECSRVVCRSHSESITTVICTECIRK